MKILKIYVKIYDVFHAFLLKSYFDQFEKNKIFFSFNVDDEIHFKIKKILINCQFKTKFQYKIKWKKYSKFDN